MQLCTSLNRTSIYWPFAIESGLISSATRARNVRLYTRIIDVLGVESRAGCMLYGGDAVVGGGLCTPCAWQWVGRIVHMVLGSGAWDFDGRHICRFDNGCDIRDIWDRLYWGFILSFTRALVKVMTSWHVSRLVFGVHHGARQCTTIMESSTSPLANAVYR
jgi:hypothetical protein